MTSPIEEHLANRLVAALRALPALAGFAIHANWGEANGRNPLAEGGCRESRAVDVTVLPRRHEDYTSAVATVAVEIAAHVDLGSRCAHVTPECIYLAVVGLAELWHGSIVAAKRDLGSGAFAPVGVRLDGGGEWSKGGGARAADFTVPLTVKGRVINNLKNQGGEE